MRPISISYLGTGPASATAEPRETFSRGPQTFSRGPSGENVFEFFFSKWYTLAYIISGRRRGAPNIAGPFIFGDDRFRGFWLAEGQNLPFPIDFEGRPYNTHTIV